LNPSGEEGILLIKALCGLERVVSNVNIPNSYLQVANLPKSAIVETNAVFERDAIRPIFAGEIPENILELTMPHVENHELTIEAAFSYDKSLVVKAFMNDPLVRGRASKEEVEELVNDMIGGTLKYLPSGWDK
ncbi:MAG: alpha-glucosidase/alpha-galactosidase, partial [Clostridiales bacterium]|nr:alpha-glucosidase/alpha-galactosidase [Clostridiales bacterium]